MNKKSPKNEQFNEKRAKDNNFVSTIKLWEAGNDGAYGCIDTWTKLTVRDLSGVGNRYRFDNEIKESAHVIP